MIAFGELERIGKEAIVAYFKVLSWHSPAAPVENQGKFAVKLTTGPKIETGTSTM
jgi:hypothetical protein